MGDGDDLALLRAWKTGDRRAGDALSGRYYRGVLRFFELRASRDAQDLTQKTFLALFDAAERLGAGDSVRAYLFGIARRQLLLFQRNAARRERLSHFGPPAPGTPTGMSTLVARVQEQQLLLRALVSLPEATQTLLCLYYWERLSSAELSSVLAVNPSTLRNRISAARQSLADHIARMDAPAKTLESVGARLDEWAQSLAVHV